MLAHAPAVTVRFRNSLCAGAPQLAQREQNGRAICGPGTIGIFYEQFGKNGTTAKFRMIHLQRLADPTRPWHRYSLRAKGGRLYFTLGDLQSDIWVTDLEQR